MVVEVNTKAICQIDISPEEAFRILCKTLGMECVLTEDDFVIKNDENGESMVYICSNGEEQPCDDRVDLFVALCNVAVNMFPNVPFRSSEFIYNK